MFCLVTLSSAFRIHNNSTSRNSVLRGDNPITLDDIFYTSFGASGFSGSWVSGNSIFVGSGGTYNIQNLVDDTEETIFQTSEISDISISSISLSPEHQYILIGYDRKQVFRHSITSKFLVWNTLTKQRITVANSDDLQVCRWAGEENLVFVKNNDLYVWISGEESRLTDTGVPGVVYNGVTDWVYEEEIFGTDYAFWLSPNENRLAYATFNDVYVDKFTYDLYDEPGEIDNQYPEHVTIRYPKAGTTNPTVALIVQDFNSQTYEIQPPAVVTDDHVLFNVAWLSNDVLLVTWTDRRQQIGSIQRCTLSATTVTCVEAASITEPNGWIETFTFYCYPDAEKCFYESNYENWRHISSISVDGTIQVETVGDITVQSIYGYDPETTSLYV